ncbi:hypothetical protein RchiOBHm_Chr7g0242481 [Rosa chinensis]|uniref:Uncharacterized protein n=1 Tax=Rosa chinensis TaxID=74649 RepID=A0A2P6PIH8_ROSCH|nr:hypothetical protein RchiOBHm_Chr7g0242481 [Rosa chinensis]
MIHWGLLYCTLISSITSALRYPTLGVTVSCSKIEADADNEDRLSGGAFLHVLVPLSAWNL